MERQASAVYMNNEIERSNSDGLLSKFVQVTVIAGYVGYGKKKSTRVIRMKIKCWQIQAAGSLFGYFFSLRVDFFDFLVIDGVFLSALAAANRSR